MSKKTSKRTRRSILKSAVVGGGVLGATHDKWAKPVIEAVVLPSHAATTGGGDLPGQKSTSSKDLNQSKLDYDIV